MHLFRERALRAIGIVLQAKVLIDLQQALLLCDGFHEKRSAGVVAEKPRRRGLEPSIRKFGRQFREFPPGVPAPPRKKRERERSPGCRQYARSPIKAISFGVASERSV